MTITPKFIIICREAFLEAGTNNLSLIRIFSIVNAPSFPHMLPSFSLVVNFDVDEPGNRMLVTEITAPDGKPAGRSEMPVVTNAGNWQVIANFEQFRAALPGTYSFRITLDGQELGVRTLEIKPGATPKATKNAALA